MAPATITMAVMVNRLLSEPEFDRVAVLTTETTGNPTLFGLAIDRPRELTILQYVDDDLPHRGYRRRAMSLTDLATHIDIHNLAGYYDVVVVDPFHTYRSSRVCLELGLALLRPGGVAFVHDCLPSVALISPVFVKGDWSGVTFAAFRDLCLERGLSWCTINDDFGVGVAVVDDAQPATIDGIDGQIWPDSASLGSVMAEYEADPIGLMRGVDPSFASEAVKRVRNGLAVDDLGPDQGRVHEPREAGTVAAPDTVEVARLRAALDDSVLALSELQNRPSRQLRALGRSVPLALSHRVGNLLRTQPSR